MLTSTSGSKPSSTKRRHAPAHGLDSEVPVRHEAHSAVVKPLPPPTIRAGLPYLWAGQIDGRQEQGHPVQGDTPVPPAAPPAPPSAAVRSGLPFLWLDMGRADTCEEYLAGNCPHGISGKVNGVCKKRHPKRCNKYMKWGRKHEFGCKLETCDKAHPILCEKSHDLECLDVGCTFKLHAQKCNLMSVLKVIAHLAFFV